MTSKEKVDNCLTIGPIKDRKGIPLFPHLLTFPGRFAGKTQKEIIDNPQAWLDSLSYFYEHIGKPDVSMPTPPGDVIFVMGLEAKRPGYELGDDEQYQFIETPQMDIDDYHDIVKNGWMQWYSRYLCRIQHPPLQSGEELGKLFMSLGMNTGMTAGFLAQNGIEPMTHSATAPIFDTLSLVRSFEEFIFDLMDEPELIHDVLRRGTPEITGMTIENVIRAGGDRACLFAMRSDTNSISPDIFDAFVFPYLKQTIRAFHNAGIKTVIHADGNWLPIMDRFLPLPKGSVLFELDGETDIFKAHELLDGQHSVRGDVPATMFAFGTYDDVRNYCEELITRIGMKGGFMLGSGCEIPLNAKPENIKAMFDAINA